MEELKVVLKKQYHTVVEEILDQLILANTVPHCSQSFKCFEISQVVQDVFHEPFSQENASGG